MTALRFYTPIYVTIPSRPLTGGKDRAIRKAIEKEIVLFCAMDKRGRVGGESIWGR